MTEEVKFTFLQANDAAGNAFMAQINGAISLLPVIGPPAPHDRIIHLAHFSASESPIAWFHKNATYSWTQNVSNNAKTMGWVTALHDPPFRQIYLIRLGVNHQHRPRENEVGHMHEFAIDMMVLAGQFARMALHLDRRTGLYSIT